jgi:hypothetical protein
MQSWKPTDLCYVKVGAPITSGEALWFRTLILDADRNKAITAIDMGLELNLNKEALPTSLVTLVAGKGSNARILGLVEAKLSQLHSATASTTMAQPFEASVKEAMRAYYKEDLDPETPLLSAEEEVEALSHRNSLAASLAEQIAAIKGKFAASIRTTAEEEEEEEEELIFEDPAEEELDHFRALLRKGKAGVEQKSSGRPGKPEEKGEQRKFPLLTSLEKPTRDTKSQLLRLAETKHMANPDVAAMIQLETLKVLQQMQRRGRGHDSDSEGEEELKTSAFGSIKSSSGVAKTLKDFHSAKTIMEKKPERVIQEWVDMSMEELGADGGGSFNLLDLNRRFPWGKFKSLQRSHMLMLRVVKLSLEEKHAQATALAIQSLKVFKQVALDQGKWEQAYLLSFTKDPCSRIRFGGTEKELELMAAYHRQLEELERKVGKNVEGAEEDPSEEKPKKKK